MKLLFIHGFVEDHTIFNEIRKAITQGEQIALDLEKILISIAIKMFNK